MSVVEMRFTTESESAPTHSVEFFEQSGFPARRLADWLGEAAHRRGGVAVLAMSCNLEPLRAALADRIDVTTALRNHQLLLIDADAVYRELLAEPDARDEILARRVGEPVRELAHKFGRARAYGELVDVLCRAGDREGALALEAWWNRRLEALPIELRCGYAVESFSDAASLHAFRRVCDHHGEVIASGSIDGASPSRTAVELHQVSAILSSENLRRLALESAYECSRISERRTRDHLVILHRISSALCEAVTYRDIGEVVVGALADALGAERCALVIDGAAIVSRGVAFPDDEPGAASALDGLDASWSRGDDRAPGLPWLGGDAIAIVPIRSAKPGAADSRSGTLALGFAGEAARPDCELIDHLARQVAVAISRARAYEIAERERARADAANAAKDGFLAMLGHELRNPLSPILTATQLMTERAPNTLARERSIIDRCVARMIRLVDDLLDVARITRCGLDLVRAPIDVAELVAHALELTQAEIANRNHRIHVAIDPGIVVDVDRARMSQAIANLVTNAAKYTPRGGAIEITALARAERVELAVRDNGIGISAELLPRVFELFVQGGQGIERANGGLGVGLAIAHAIVEHHGGTLGAASDGAGTGSCFTLTIPCAPGVDPELPTLTSPGRILVVDDNEDAAWLLAEALRTAGHEVSVSHDGLDALDIARRWGPEIAFLDLGLPGIDGYTLCRHLRELPTQPKVVAITGFGQASDRARSAAAGFDLHFVKPVTLRQVHSAIATFSRRRPSGDLG